MEYELATTSYNNMTLDNTTSVWTTDAPEPPYRLVLWIILESIIGSLGVIGNGLVLIVFFRSKSRHLVNLFIINQSMIDFTSSVVYLLIHLGPKVQLIPGNPVHSILCKVWVSEYVMWSLFISSSTNLVCITLERYIATMKPAWYRKKVVAVKKRIVVVAACVWAFGFLIDAIWAAVQEVLTGNLCVPIYSSPASQAISGITIFFVTYLGPLSVMAFSYTSIVRKLRQQTAKVQAQSPARTLSSRVNATEPRTVQGSLLNNKRNARASNTRSRATRNVIQTMMIVSATYAITWAPIAFNYLIFNLGGPLDFTSVWYEVTKLFVHANMCANPFIYAMQYRQFQIGLKRLCCCCTKELANRDLTVSVLGPTSGT